MQSERYGWAITAFNSAIISSFSVCGIGPHPTPTALAYSSNRCSGHASRPASCTTGCQSGLSHRPHGFSGLIGQTPIRAPFERLHVWHSSCMLRAELPPPLLSGMM
jgi:hypothetical protein